MTEGDLGETIDQPAGGAGAPVPDVRRSSPMPIIAVIAAVVLVADQVTKRWALSTLAGRPPRHVVWTLQWNLSFNSGMAFSRGQGVGPLIGVLALVVAGAIVVSVRRHPSRWISVAAGLVVGGALGNVTDRLFRGEGWLRGSVIDFIDFKWFPIFNVADMGVNIGGAVFVLWTLLGSGRHERAS
jgi:signal peptidase II